MILSPLRWLLFFILVYNVKATCTDDLSFEFPDAYNHFVSVNAEPTPTGYLLEPADYHVPDACTCGVIKQWQFYAGGAGAIQLQVWNRQESNNYILMGENYYTVPASAVGRKIEFLVPPKDRITVRNGYLIGWYTLAGVNVVSYEQGPQDDITSPFDEFPDGIKMQTAMPDTNVGEVFDWNSGSVTIFEDTVYAFGATVLSNTAPEFTNLDHKVIIYPSWVAGAIVYTVSVDDLDSYDLDSLEVTMADDITEVFLFDRSTYDVSLITSSPSETSTDTELTFTVTDQCGNSATGKLYIEVRNQFPLITNLPLFTTIDEETTEQVLLASVTITDGDDDNLLPTINVDPAQNIVLRSEGTDNSQSIYSDAGATYTYTSQQIYVIDVTADDGTDTSNTGYALLYITKNDPPKITNLGQAAYLNTSFVSTVNGEKLFTIETTDAESDPLTFTITCDPDPPCPIDKNPTDGVIRTTSDFQGFYEPGYDLVVEVSDGMTTIDTKTLTILVQEITYRPQITNPVLDHAIVIAEGTALDTTVYSLSYVDLDTSETHTIYAELDPGWAWNYFSLNATSGVITTANNLIDYEFLDSYTATLTITVTDSYGPTSVSVTIEFGDVNEAPSFRQTKYTLEPGESATSGTSAGDPQFEIYDPDAGDTHFYSWDCGETSRFFALDMSNAAITYATDFDLDDLDDVNIKVPFTCTVTVTDSGGLTGTTQLEIDIHDDNDNAPVFTQTVDYIIFAEPTLTSGRLVGQISATDADYSSTNNAIYYTVDDFNNLFEEEFFYINNYGNMYVNTSWTSPTFDYGITHVFRVIAQNMVDTTATRQSATTTVSLVIAAISTTTTSTTDRPADFIGDTRNVAWLSVALALGSIVLITLCLFTLYYTVSTKKYRWCCPVCRYHLLGLTKVMKKKKIERYKHILRREEEGLSSSSSESSESSSESSDSDTDTLPSAKPRSFKPWQRNDNSNIKSADSRNFKPWTRTQKL